MEYCMDCKYFSTKVRGSNKKMFDGYCKKIKKNIYETNPKCKYFEREEIII
ncbi:MAG: hypothetical protein ACE5KT_02550 [Methanosarcinales archaeon]